MNLVLQFNLIAIFQLRNWKEEAWQAKGNVIGLVDEKKYKMDYSELKRMTEDRTEWRRQTQELPNGRIPKEENELFCNLWRYSRAKRRYVNVGSWPRAVLSAVAEMS